MTVEKNLVVKSNPPIEIQLDSKLLGLIATIEDDVSRAVSDALVLWLKEKLLICPITKDFCVNKKSACNTCIITSNGKIRY